METYLIYAAVLIVGFLLGALIMGARSRKNLSRETEHTNQVLSQSDQERAQYSSATTAATHKLELAHLQNTLASAAIDARRGDYESARQAASSYFTALSAEASKGDDSVLSQNQITGIKPVFGERDDIISMLSRNDPAVTERLSNLYVSFREIVSKQ